MTEENCRDCACLVEDNGKWVCDECSKPICEVGICPEGNNVFDITIEEVVSETFKVRANSVDEALKKIREGYLDGNYILEPGNLEGAKAIHFDSGKELEIC